ncbi:hypothetical protein AAHA92_25629 [Salvia divinorum]|uniref:Uncharacterized protein n=1 Tax=Salvia divinorum TaxID=28513 RepID=A0ABD1GDW5_SALDI
MNAKLNFVISLKPWRSVGSQTKNEAFGTSRNHNSGRSKWATEGAVSGGAKVKSAVGGGRPPPTAPPASATETKESKQCQ